MATTFLKLDYDGRIPSHVYDRVIWVVRTVCNCTPNGFRIRRTQHGYHVVVTIPRRVAPTSVVAMQAILGSDYKRETFNLLRVRNLQNVPPFFRGRWNVLYTRHNKPLRERVTT